MLPPLTLIGRGPPLPSPPLTIREISHYPICDGGGWKKPDCSLVRLYLYCTLYTVYTTLLQLPLSFSWVIMFLYELIGEIAALFKDKKICLFTIRRPTSCYLSFLQTAPYYQLSDKLLFLCGIFILQTGEFEKLSDYWKSDQWLNLSRLLDAVGLTKIYRYDWRGFVKAKKDEHRPLSI
jgi:hypothetical protein